MKQQIKTQLDNYSATSDKRYMVKAIKLMQECNEFSESEKIYLETIVLKNVISYADYITISIMYCRLK